MTNNTIYSIDEWKKAIDSMFWVDSRWLINDIKKAWYAGKPLTDAIETHNIKTIHTTVERTPNRAVPRTIQR